MSIENLKNLIPEYAKDLKLNLSNLVREETLTSQQLWGTLMATALAASNPIVIEAIEAEARQHLSVAALEAAKAASAIMAMNNVYYKFTGMLSQYRDLPARLRMSVIANPGVDRLDFELWSLAVSAINGCQYCVQAHEKELSDGGIGILEIQTAVRIAAVVNAVSVALGGEESLKGGKLSAAA